MHIFDATPLNMVSCNHNDVRTLRFLGRSFHGGEKSLVVVVHLNTKALEELKDIVNRHLPKEEKS